MEQPPFHNPNFEPLPDANDVEAEFGHQRKHQDERREAVHLSEAHRSHLQSDKRKLRNFIIGLLVVGLAVGALLSIGLVWGMHRLDLVNPPTLNSD